MDEVNPEEELFERLAVALGESLEQVWSMPDVERRQLIEVLNLGPVEEQERQRDADAAISMDEESRGNSNEKVRIRANQEEKKRLFRQLQLRLFARRILLKEK